MTIKINLNPDVGSGDIFSWLEIKNTLLGKIS